MDVDIAVGVVGKGFIIHEFVKALMTDARSIWPVLALLGVVAGGRLGLAGRRARRLARSGIRQVDVMDGRQFEEFLGSLFKAKGYRVELTPYLGDYGADLVIAKGPQRWAVQAKRSARPIGIKAVQEVVASMGHYGCSKALVVSNNTYTPQARRLARDNTVELWDREKLVSEMLAARGETRCVTPRLPDLALPLIDQNALPAADQDRCKTCGRQVTAKVRQYCIDRPGRFAGAVYWYGHQREVARSTADA